MTEMLVAAESKRRGAPPVCDVGKGNGTMRDSSRCNTGEESKFTVSGAPKKENCFADFDGMGLAPKSATANKRMANKRRANEDIPLFKEYIPHPLVSVENVISMKLKDYKEKSANKTIINQSYKETQ